MRLLIVEPMDETLTECSLALVTVDNPREPVWMSTVRRNMGIPTAPAAHEHMTAPVDRTRVLALAAIRSGRTILYSLNLANHVLELPHHRPTERVDPLVELVEAFPHQSREFFVRHVSSVIRHSNSVTTPTRRSVSVTIPLADKTR